MGKDSGIVHEHNWSQQKNSLNSALRKFCLNSDHIDITLKRQLNYHKNVMGKDSDIVHEHHWSQKKIPLGDES
jgi:hypothetical protein